MPQLSNAGCVGPSILIIKNLAIRAGETKKPQAFQAVLGWPHFPATVNVAAVFLSSNQIAIDPKAGKNQSLVQ